MTASSASRPLLAGVELGGSKCVCILGSGPADIRAQVQVPTRTPGETLQAVEAVLDAWRAAGFAALGLAAFGPLDLRRDSPRFGWVAGTPKPDWSHTELLGRFARRYSTPTGIDTDVNAAALAEGRWGGACGVRNFAYVTVGTGIGAGVIIDGRPVSGAHHTELGHIRIVREPGDDFPGTCTFHGDCLEGLASGPSIAARTQRDPASVADEDPAWEHVAHALAQLCQTLVLGTGAQRIFFGGGVVNARPALFARIRARLQSSLNGYLGIPELAAGLDQFIVPSQLGTCVGPLGALALAAAALPGS